VQLLRFPTVANPGSRIGSLIVCAPAEPEGGGDDEAPSSETRPLDVLRARTLRVFMCLRGSDAPQRAWLTVTDHTETTLFEGWLSVEDGVEIALTTALTGAPVRLLLETERWHRQAQLTLSEDLTEHVFV
jgi:hypothetical protein